MAETPRPGMLLKKLIPLSGEGELKMAAGDDSWLIAGFETGEASLEPLVFSPFMDCVNDFCLDGLVLANGHGLTYSVTYRLYLVVALMPLDTWASWGGIR